MPVLVLNCSMTIRVTGTDYRKAWLAGVRLGVVHQLLQRFEGQRWIYREDLRPGCNGRDAGEVSLGVIGQVGEGEGTEHQLAHARHTYGIAVGLCFHRRR